MSMDSHPIRDVGLLIDREVAAYIILCYDQRENTIPVDVRRAVRDGRFADMAKSGGSGLPKYYYDPAIAKEALEEMAIDPVYCSEFYGTATPLLNEDMEDTRFDGTYMAYVPAQNGPNLFRPAYEGSKALVAEFKDVLKDILPDKFDIRPHLVRIEGTYVA